MKYNPQLMGKWDWICTFSYYTVVSRRPSKEKKALLIGQVISPGDGIQIISPVNFFKIFSFMGGAEKYINTLCWM
jgi:hypothetical protein